MTRKPGLSRSLVKKMFRENEYIYINNGVKDSDRLPSTKNNRIQSSAGVSFILNKMILNGPERYKSHKNSIKLMSFTLHAHFHTIRFHFNLLHVNLFFFETPKTISDAYLLRYLI